MIATVQHLPCFKDLIAVLFECFLIITLGYLSCRFKLISTQAKDLNSYLTTFALPMIIFLNIAQMNFQTINLSFLLCMLTSKLLVFILVTIITLIISYPTNFGYAGALSILATQSNDFALGYPLIKSLYGDTRSEMLDYLNLMAPIQLLILNPLGIVMLEYQKSRKIRILNKEKKLCKTIININNNNNNDDDDDDNNNNMTGHGSHEDDESNDENDDVQHNSKSSVVRVCDCGNSIIKGNQNYLSCSKQQQHKYHISNAGSIGDDGFVSDIGDGSRLRQQLRRRMSANEKADECLQTINEKVIRKQQSTSSSILKVGSKNIKSLKLILPEIENNIDRSDSDSSLRPLAAAHGSQYNNIATAVCCYCIYNNNNRGDNIVNSKSRSDNIITNRPSVGGEGGGISSVRTNVSCSSTTSTTVLNLNFIKALATNPLIIASVVALAVNLIHGPQLPKFVTKVSNTIAASFAAPALFVVGLSMFGKFELILKNPNDLLLSSVLVLTKVILLPSLMRTLALIILPAHTPAEEIPYLIDFSFLYGLLPTAPTACIIAKQYGVLTNVVSISMLLSIFLSAPLMLAASVIINPASVIKLTAIQNLISQTLKYSSLITLILASIALYAFWKTKHRSNYNKFINLPLEIACRQVTDKIKINPAHIFLFLLATTQIIIGLGGLSWYFVDTSNINPTLLNLSLKTSSQQHINSDNIQMKNYTSKIIEKLSPPTNVDHMNISNNDVIIESEQPILIDLPAPIPTDSNAKSSSGEEDYAGHDQTKPLIQIKNSISINKQPSILIHQKSVTFQTWSAIQYVLASYGILLARFVILSILVTTATIRFRGYITATKVSSIMVKSFLSISFILIIWLIYDTQQQENDLYSPVESIIPNKKASLYIRLTYDTLFLILSIPLFALIIRTDNRTKRLLQKKISGTLISPIIHDEFIYNTEDDCLAVGNNANGCDDNLRSIKGHNFIRSNVSLSSDTSSALTANTNLESTPISNIVINDCSQHVEQQHSASSMQNIDSVSVLIENNTVSKRVLDSILNNSNQNNDSNSIEVECNQFNANTYNTSNNNNQQQSMQTISQDRDQIKLDNYKSKIAAGLIQMSEFNKYSILILFMLITTTLNLTSIIQKLVQDKPFGTFRQIEIMSVALEFGQGLLTFLVYGIKETF